MVSQLRGAASQFFLFDGLGSTDRLTDSSANITDNYVYQAFGSIKASTGTSANPFRFVGQSGYYLNPDLLDYSLLARALDPGMGRLLARGPNRL